MATSLVRDLPYEYIFHWKMENFYTGWMEGDEMLSSPTFIAGVTKWSMKIYYEGHDGVDDIHLGFFMHREDCNEPEEIEVNFEVKFRNENGTIFLERHLPAYRYIRNRLWGLNCFDRSKSFNFEKNLCQETTMVECQMYKKEESILTQTHLFARTTFNMKERKFTWKTDKFSTLKYGVSKEFKDDVIDFHFFLNEKEFLVNINAIDDSINLFGVMSCIKTPNGVNNCSLHDDFYSRDFLKKAGKLITRNFDKQLILLQSKSIDDVSLDFVYYIPITTANYVSHEIYKKPSKRTENIVVNGKDETLRTSMLVKDLKFLYNDAICSDIELRISTKAFKAHKSILSARSPVFRSMFSCDMKEKNTGHVNITDFEEDTVHRMLMYIYTDSLEDLQFENASNLYKIADKYEILSLKSRCSSFLKENLSLENACDVLVLADLHNDEDLKSTVQDYILKQSKTFFASENWKNFMDNNLKLASDVMYKNILK